MIYMLTFVEFNLVEGGFWIICAVASFAILHFTDFLSKRFRYVLATNFALFGASDVVEAYYPVTFLDQGGEFLFVWKIVCVLGFVAILVWYLKIRIKNS